MRISTSLRILLAFLTTTTVALDARNSRYCCVGSGRFKNDDYTTACCDLYNSRMFGSDKPVIEVVNKKLVCGMRIWGNSIDYKFGKCCEEIAASLRDAAWAWSCQA